MDHGTCDPETISKSELQDLIGHYKNLKAETKKNTVNDEETNQNIVEACQTCIDELTSIYESRFGPRGSEAEEETSEG